MLRVTNCIYCNQGTHYTRDHSCIVLYLFNTFKGGSWRKYSAIFFFIKYFWSNFVFIGIYFILQLLSWLCLYPILSRYCHKDRSNDRGILIWNFIFPICHLLALLNSFPLEDSFQRRRKWLSFQILLFCQDK